MSNTSEKEACTKRCWYIGGGIGLLLALILWGIGGWGFVSSVFAGIIVAVIAGWLLQNFLCAGIETASSASSSSASQSRPASQSAAVASTATTAGAAAPAAAKASTAANADQNTTASGLMSDPVAKEPDNKTAAKKPAAKKKAPAKKTTAKKTAAKSAGAATTSSEPVAAPAAKKPAAKKATAKKAEAAPAAEKTASKKAAAAPAKAVAKPKGSAKPARKPVAADGKPEMLSKARAGGADDLKLISGVGPKLEGTLNELGVYHYDQVAGWRKKEIEWVDARLRFKGRIERDGWIAQAKILAKGGETEFSKRKKKT